MNTNTERDELAEVLANARYSNLVPAWPLRADRSPVKFFSRKEADAVLAAGYRKPRTITTVEELDAAIVRSFEQGENLVLIDGWHPWIIWENDHGDIRVSSLPVEGDPDHLSLSDITFPALVLCTPEPTR